MIIEAQYNYLLVTLSYIISVFGSYACLQLVNEVDENSKKIARRILMASISLGGGAIWSMHFIGMLAFDNGMPVNYDPSMTLASLLLAIVVVACSLTIVVRHPHSYIHLVGSGILSGLGVSGMHYLGMDAMIMEGVISYDMSIVALSVFIGIAAATAALWIAFHLKGRWLRLSAPFVMGIAVCGMHYTGMAAVTIRHGDMLTMAAGIDHMLLGLIIFAMTVFLLVISLFIALSRDAGEAS